MVRITRSRTGVKGKPKKVVKSPKSPDIKTARSELLSQFNKLGVDTDQAKLLIEACREQEKREVPIRTVPVVVGESPPISPISSPILTKDGEKPNIQRAARFPPRFCLTDTYSGNMGEDVRQFVRHFRIQAESSELTEAEQQRELQMYLRGGAIRWFDANHTQFTNTNILLEELVKHFTGDTGRRAKRRKTLSDIVQGENESVAEYNSRFEEACEDTFLRDDEYVGYYLNGLDHTLQTAVVGARTQVLAETMKAANDIFALMALLPKPHINKPTKTISALTPTVNMVVEKSPIRSPPEDERWIAIQTQLLALTAAASATKQATISTNNERTPCEKCGSTTHKTRNHDIRCFNCGELGHRSFECRKSRKRGRGEDRTGGRSKDPCDFCGIPGHTALRCFKNPASLEYKGPKQENKSSKEKTASLGN